MPKILKTILKSFIEEKVEAPKHPSCPFQKSNWGVVVRFEQSLNFIHIVPPQILEYMYMYLFLYYFFYLCVISSLIDSCLGLDLQK